MYERNNLDGGIDRGNEYCKGGDKYTGYVLALVQHIIFRQKDSNLSWTIQLGSIVDAIRVAMKGERQPYMVKLIEIKMFKENIKNLLKIPKIKNVIENFSEDALQLLIKKSHENVDRDNLIVDAFCDKLGSLVV